MEARALRLPMLSIALSLSVSFCARADICFDTMSGGQSRAYIVHMDADDNTVTLYGGCVSRSIGYIAYQNRDTFKPGTAAYEYVWGIIKAVYKNDPDIMNQYQGKGGN